MVWLLYTAIFLFHINFSFSEVIKKIPVSDFAKNDIQLILNHGYDPIDGFFNEADYIACLENMELADGTFWPIPITLRIKPEIASQISIGETVYLVDETNHPLALLELEEIYLPDKEKEIKSLFKTLDNSHPFIADLLNTQDFYVAGKVKPVRCTQIEAFQSLTLSPSDVKEWKNENKIQVLLGFQTRNPLHRAHVAAIRNSWESLKDKEHKALLLQPTIGVTQRGDVPGSIRVGCYKAILPYLKDMNVKLSLIPLPMRMAGPKEALLHALVRKNYGCTHFIVGRDHAGPSARKRDGTNYFSADESFLLAKQYEEKLGIEIVPCEEFVFVEEENTFKQKRYISSDQQIKEISGTKFRELLKNNEVIPEWFSYPEIIKILRNYYQSQKGVCFYLVGVPASGKSTLAKILKERLEVETNYSRNIIILDADSVRKNIAQELGFSKEHRSINVRRIGYLASKIVEAGGICIVSNIAPFEEDRSYNREEISRYGKYVEVFVNTPIEICMDRDPKDLYQNAKVGQVSNMTGISQNFEKPIHPEFIYEIHNREEIINKLIAQIFY